MFPNHFENDRKNKIDDVLIQINEHEDIKASKLVEQDLLL